RVATDLDVALLHHVEQRDLDALGEVGQLVDGDDPAVRPRHQAEVDGLGVAEAAAFGDLHRVDVADQVAYRCVRRGELFGVALAAVAPGDREVVAEFGGAADGRGRDRLQRVFAELGALDDRRPFVEQAGQGAQQAGLALPALAEQDDVVPGEQRALELGQYGAREADDPGPGVITGTEGGQQVLVDLPRDRSRLVPGRAKLPGRPGKCVWNSVHPFDATAGSAGRRCGAAPAWALTRGKPEPGKMGRRVPSQCDFRRLV